MQMQAQQSRGTALGPSPPAPPQPSGKKAPTWWQRQAFKWRVMRHEMEVSVARELGSAAALHTARFLARKRGRPFIHNSSPAHDPNR